ncbi:hypothetical protein J4427_01150 [Candidatus Woesearchaeota archaeon]|nr:hypothetical protein [Candidatus Woesearchaeota archaeon]
MKKLAYWVGIATISLASLVSCKSKPIESPNSIKDIATIDHTIFLSCDAHVPPKEIAYLGHPEIKFRYDWDTKTQKWSTNDPMADANIQLTADPKMFPVEKRYEDPVLGSINIRYDRFRNHNHQVCELIMISDGMRSPFLPESLTRKNLTKLHNYGLMAYEKFGYTREYK